MVLYLLHIKYFQPCHEKFWKLAKLPECQKTTDDVDIVTSHTGITVKCMLEQYRHKIGRCFDLLSGTRDAVIPGQYKGPAQFTCK